MLDRLRDLVLPAKLTLELGAPWPAPMPPPYPGFGEGIERTYVLQEELPEDPRPLRPIPEDVGLFPLAPELRGRSNELERLRRMQDPYRVCVRVGSLAERAGFREQQSLLRPGGWGVVFWRGAGGKDAHVYGEGETRAEAYIDAVRQIYGWEEDPRDVHVGPRGDGYVDEGDWAPGYPSRGGGAQNASTVRRGEGGG